MLFDLFDTLVLIQKSKDFYEPSLRKLHQILAQSRIDVVFEDFKRVYLEVRDQLYNETEENFEEPHFNIRISRVLERFGYDLDASSSVLVKATEAFADEFMRHVSLDADAKDVLAGLQQKFSLGMISNFAIPECVRKILDKYSLRGFFDVILISGAINKRKPSPEVFEKALKTLDVDAPESVFVGDMLGLDIRGAKSVGMKSILIARRPLNEPLDYEPDYIIKDLKELPPLLNDCYI